MKIKGQHKSFAVLYSCVVLQVFWYCWVTDVNIITSSMVCIIELEVTMIPGLQGHHHEHTVNIEMNRCRLDQLIIANNIQDNDDNSSAWNVTHLHTRKRYTQRKLVIAPLRCVCYIKDNSNTEHSLLFYNSSTTTVFL